MKKYAILICLAFTALTTTAQIGLGLKIGVHSFDLSPRTIFSDDPNGIDYRDAQLGFQGGIFSQIKLGRFSLEPRIMLNSTKVKYSLNNSSSVITEIKEESFTNLDVLALIGFDILFLKAVLGPVAHINLSSPNEVFNVREYGSRLKNAEYGYRSGLSATLGKLSIGIEYEGNLPFKGDNISIAGQRLPIAHNEKRLLLNIGIKIL